MNFKIGLTFRFVVWWSSRWARLFAVSLALKSFNNWIFVNNIIFLQIVYFDSCEHVLTAFGHGADHIANIVQLLFEFFSYKFLKSFNLDAT